MGSDAESDRKRLISRIVTKAKKSNKGRKATLIAEFVRHYYKNVPPGDLLGEELDKLYLSALSHWNLGLRRKAGEPSFRIYNPKKNVDGWETHNTLIEIVTDDMPFLVDSITSELNRHELTVNLVVHPIFRMVRNVNGDMHSILADDEESKKAIDESFIRVEVSEQSTEQFGPILDGIRHVMQDVRAAVEDWAPMRQQMLTITDSLHEIPKGVSEEDCAETRAFLKWAYENHYTFLGYREYEFIGAGKRRKASVVINRNSGLGILRDPSIVVFQELQNLASMPPDVKNFVRKGDMMMITKTQKKSTVHRSVHMDSIGIKRYDAKGEVTGECVFVGLFTSSAYNRSVRDIPLLRSKLKKVLDLTGFEASSHNGKALLNILETYPRDELFQVSTDYLYETALGILNLQERQRVALFVRKDDFERLVSCLIFVPRDNYTTELRYRMQKILEHEFSGEVSSYYTLLGDSPLARLHVIVETTPGKIPSVDIEEVEEKLVHVARSWTDSLLVTMVDKYGESEGHALFSRYKNAFKPAYQDRFNSSQALTDIEVIEQTHESGLLGMSLYRPAGADEIAVGFKVFNLGGPIPLSDVLPMLEDLGLRVINEIPYQVRPDGDEDGNGGNLVMIHDFGLETRDGSTVNLAAVSTKFQEAFKRVWRGDVESDGFNALVLRSGMGWRDIVVLRAYCKYLRQTGITFSQEYMEQTLSNNPHLSRSIIDLFRAAFDPDTNDRESLCKRIRGRIERELEKVVSADEDRILRRFVNLIDSTLRTNFYQEVEGEPKPYVSFKLDSHAVEELPLPRPFREIFVYSPDVEGVHLRFGKVARGGLRWSDRREDFRTEILGLVKAQQVKNTVIIPVGSKGGFVLKNPPPMSNREAFLEEGIRCYKIFISGLLDITDNLAGEDVIPPQRTYRRDDDDPYLVVAADKGTATFSDIANGVSQQYGFWLGDAFASGGSVGYDHKGMGITAKGAWESVKRHFREMGVNTQEEDFTVIGVGDMSGDVFGNGMMLSPHIRLIAAFNHMHIFIDPDPDPAKTIVERQRLFNLPRSSWTDYNTKLISKGGGIFERSAKTIKLTPEIKAIFDISKDTVTPNELLRTVLKAKSDLLWFGGIGTYIKASDETHLDVGDRANDAIRVDASDLNCKVVGEGANLGVTQRARVQAALNGVRMYTDAIDNSAGVDCSDHEVNIKILIDAVVAKGNMSQKQRNNLLARMTDEVGDLVLVDNYRQTQAINQILAEKMQVFDNQVRLMRMLEKSGRLNREVEFLPDDETLIERGASKMGLTGPEIAVLMSYSKIWVYDELLDSDAPDDPELVDDLIDYFPTPLRKKFKEEIITHRLRREIIASLMTNSIINRAGGTFVNQLVERTGMPASEVARAYIIARRVLDVRRVWREIDALDNKVPAAVQTAMLLDINHLMGWVTLWFLRNGRRPLDIASHVKEFRDGFATLFRNLSICLPAHYMEDVRERGKPYVEAGVPEQLAHHISSLVNLDPGCDIIRLAARRKMRVEELAPLYYAVGTRFKLGSLRAASDRLDVQTHWQKLAVAALIEEIFHHQLALTSQVLDDAGVKRTQADPAKAIDIWAEKNSAAVNRTEHLISELSASEINDLSMIAVASRQLRTLAETPTAD